jgi:hypothetical protein
MTITLDLEEAKQLVDRAIAEKGADYVYEQVSAPGYMLDTCAYFNPQTGEPSCIVGHVLAYKGLTLAQAVAGEWNTGVTARGLKQNYGVLDADAATLIFLNGAQESQDDGETWGKAREHALADLAEEGN